MGARPLGSTLEFKPSSSFAHKGKFLDEVFVYPSNHEYMVGSSKDTLDEMNRKHVSLIVPKPIIDDNNVYEQSSTIYSFHDLFNRLIPNCLQFWNE